MTVPGHIAGAYLTLRLTDMIYPGVGLDNPWVIAAGVIAGVLPDIDVFFYKHHGDHHNSPLHTPVFCVVVFAGLTIGAYFFGASAGSYVLAAFLGVFSHLFLDWYGGRVAGVRLAYPWSTKRYSLFPLHPEQGNVPVKGVYTKDYFVFYTKNKFLFASEAILLVTAIGLFIAYPNYFC